MCIAVRLYPPLSTSDHYGIVSTNKELRVRAVEFGDIHMQIGMVPVRLLTILILMTLMLPVQPGSENL